MQDQDKKRRDQQLSGLSATAAGVKRALTEAYAAPTYDQRRAQAQIERDAAQKSMLESFGKSVSADIGAIRAGLSRPMNQSGPTARNVVTRPKRQLPPMAQPFQLGPVGTNTVLRQPQATPAIAPEPPPQVTPVAAANPAAINAGPPRETFAEGSARVSAPGQQGFVGTNTGVRTLNADGTPTPGRGPVTAGVTYVPSTAFTNPSTGALARELGVNRRALTGEQAPAGQARGGNLAASFSFAPGSADRLSQRLGPSDAREGTFRPGTGAGLNGAQRNEFNIARAAAQAQQRQLGAQGAQQGAADASALQRQQLQIAAGQEAQQAQIAAQASEGAASRAAQNQSQLVDTDAGLMFVNPNDASGRAVTNDGQPVRRLGQAQQRNYEQENESRAVAQIMKGLIDPATGQQFPDAYARAKAQYAAANRSQQKPDFAKFSQDLRALNPNATDEELRAEYVATFGG